MVSWLKHIGDIFSKIIGGAAHIFTKENVDKAFGVAAYVSDLIAFASPYAEMLASATEGATDDELVAAAEKMNLKVHDILSEPDESVRKGRILTLIGNATKTKIAATVASAAGQKIKIGNISIRVPEDVSRIAGDLFDLAAQSAYSLFIKKRDALATAPVAPHPVVNVET